MAKEFTSRDAKNLIGKAESTLSSLRGYSGLDAALKENIKKAADACASFEVISVLRGVPVEELNRDKKGIRVKTLAENGFSTMADVYAASVYNLASVRGISEDAAYTIKRAASLYAEKTRREIKLKLSSDDKNKYSTELVKAVSIYKNSLPLIKKCGELYSKNSGRVKAGIEMLKPASKTLRWIFTSKAVKAKAAEAYAELSALLNGDYGKEVDSAISGINRLSKTNDGSAWADFAKNNIVFYNILEELTPGLLGTDDVVYGLPEELAREVRDECFFPEGLKCTLRRYQEWGVKYILHQGKVLLGDEMGLGKTVQAIAAMVSLKNTGATHFVVVCPASVLTNWCREIAKHSLLSVTKVHGGGRKAALKSWIASGGVAVTTYETTAYFELENRFRFSMLVVDEAHYIKNPEAKRTVNTVALCAHAERLLFMTGTALENKVDEMINLIRILRPYIAAQLHGIAFMSSAPQFRNKVAPVYYRRKRADVLTELPELIESREWCAMGREEERAYENALLGDNYMAVRRLSWNVDDLNKSSKANRLKEIVNEAEAEGRKVIVFSYFLETLRKIYEFLGARCMNPINGSVSPQRRQEIIDEFDKAPAGSVLISQIQSGGTGLNIQAASVVVICEPQFKPSIENQAISRAYRMGQARSVLVYRLLCEDTIDEKITDLLESKQAIFDAFADKSVSAQQSIEIDDKSYGQIIAEEIVRIKAKRASDGAPD